MIDTTIKTQYPVNTRKKLFYVWTILLTAWIVMTIIPPVFKDKTGRLFADTSDRNVYFERGKWFTEGTYPISEYPQIPTWLFGIDHLASMWIRPSMQLAVYIAVFSLEMMFVLFLIFKVLLELLPPELGNYAFLVLLPPILYFTYNRFDILPAFLCLIAYSAATRRRWTIVSVILAMATFTKWYPVLLFPGFFMYAKTTESKFQWKMILGFAITSSAILLLSYFYGGIDAILAPYRFHAARGMEFTAFPVLIDNLIHGILGAQISPPYFFLYFFILQISAPALIFFIKFDSLAVLSDYCIVVTGIFILFSRIWSPQWFLWLLPFLIISAKNIKTAGWIIAYSIATYLCFPVFFDYYGSSSYQLQIISMVTYLILIVIIFQSFRGLAQVSIFAKMKTDR